MAWGPDGVVLKKSAELTPEDAACVSEASQTVTLGGGSIRVKLCDKLQALHPLGEHLGLFLDRLEVKSATRLVIEEEVERWRSIAQENPSAPWRSRSFGIPIGSLPCVYLVVAGGASRGSALVI